MSENLNRAGIHAVLGAGSLILNDYALNITHIERGYRLTVTRGSETQTMDILDGVGIVGIEKTGSTGDVDSYRISFTDGSTFDYTVETNSAAHAAAEAARVEAENSRVSAEAARVYAESGRVDAEAGRVAGEAARESAEAARVNAESARAHAEDGRQSTEAARVAAEQSRASAESVRVAAENARTAAENARANAENERAGAETLRVAAETERANAESGRVSAEQGRVAAESERVANEIDRVSAETERNATFSGYQNEIDQFKTELVTSKDAATESTRFAIGEAEESLEVPSMDEFTQLKGDINNQREYLVNDYQSINRCDNNNMADGMAIDYTSGKLYENASYVSTDYIDVSGLSIIALYACLTDAFTPYNEFWRGAWYAEDKTYMTGLNNHPTVGNPQRGVLTVPDGARYVRVCFYKHNNYSFYMCTSDGSLVDYVPYLYGHKDIITYPDWSGKSWLSYGDSITAIGNPTYIDGKIGEISEGSWQRKVRDYMYMGKCYGRGIGGQTFTYNARPWFANPDGTYHSRDDNGDMTDTSSYTVPEGCTAHYGYFASWDRITTMIPDSIKDSIDLITVFGVNDAMAALNFDPTTWTAPIWKLDSELTGVRDEAWLAADESITNSNNHGDFDITDLNGAIASTILKLQARCPNAVIVFGTSWSGKGGGESATNTGGYDTDGIAYYKHGQLVKTVAHYYSIPVVDIWGTSGVNPFNRNANNQDSTHPYKSHGKMMLAKAWIGGLKGIAAMID